MKNTLLKKSISLICALAMVLSIGFTALPNKVHAAETISIPFYVTTDVGEVEITVSNGGEKVSKTASKDGEITLEIAKKDSGNYTIIAKQKNLYKPPYDIVLQPETSDNNSNMKVLYSRVKDSEVNEEGLEANMQIEASVSLHFESDGTITDFEHNNYNKKDVMIEVPTKDINDIVRLNRPIRVGADRGVRFTDFNLKINKGENPYLEKFLTLNFALYYEPKTVINKANTDYKVLKSVLPSKYNYFCFNGEAMHKFDNSYNLIIEMNQNPQTDYKIGVVTGNNGMDIRDGEAYLTVVDTNSAKMDFTNNILAETIEKRDAKTESLEDLRSSDQNYKDLYAPKGGTILIHWPQAKPEEEKVLEHKIIKTCTNSEVKSDEEKAIFDYTIEVPTAHNFSRVHIFDKFDAPKGAKVKYIKDSIKINGIAAKLDDSDYENFSSENGFEFKVDELGQTFGPSKYTDEVNKVDDETHKVTISYSVEVDKYGDYTNTAESYFGDFNYKNEEKVAEDSVKVTLKKPEKKEKTYEKTKREDIKIDDENYDKAIIKYNKPFYKGYPGDIFKPENPISRAEIATVFARILGIEHNKVKNPDMFNDLEGHWAKDNIIRIAEYGASKNKIISGYPDGRFKPNGNITRAEFAKMIATYWDIKGFKPNISEANIKDIKDHWAKDYIRALYNHRFVDLYSDKSFKPNQKLKRSEVSQILNRITDRSLIKLNVPLYHDVPKTHSLYDEINTASSVAKEK